MADNTKLVCGLEENMGRSQKISISDHINGFQYTADESDSFVIDMESFSRGPNKDITSNSRITLQRSLSRKGPQRGGEKKITQTTNTITAAAAANERDHTVVTATSSPRGSSTPEKLAAAAAAGTMDNSSSPQVHQITITTGNMISTPTESRCISRRNSFRRPPWVLDPKKILFFFATLSSMGTILLIYFTLSIGKLHAKENGLDW
ncbi:uncharacterized protein LOC122279139 isoform X1 [Carya illinoinensis]|uniref:Uncharacterized protein n=1 Tax=Carya illinoinensis TaxID=32201 RepID=A0A8T1P8K1_CARIL|nr:uncharacterized protein LOC122279139 isoform X1 [Carya illinoinensis]XP_042945448.1 uncharacterized protein LOC122279139 isoform X1 [Carya illinoinensis]KAG6638955.1 hypothetical protein CIPAW_10G068100 [Carya illinoinensis]KAG6638956.1 hypothetical protein CIPAW_10G068100 [Carya illinoinensis]KAG6638957.1 hypothetical protein CIPAW_10G068100 [Carya illinoinensis]KAG6638958.1 hypothetical protein CIPAW_10G068100 [Carya illinoinensis]KAG6691523.1 hypothetical protein I3842_10G067500 [Carya 